MNQDLIVFFQEIIYLKKIMDRAYVINLNEYADVGTHWIALFCNRNTVNCFDSFGVEHVLKEIIFVGNKNIIANISVNNSVICGYFCIGFIDFMLVGKKLTDFANLFSPHNLKKKTKYNFVLFQK